MLKRLLNYLHLDDLKGTDANIWIYIITAFYFKFKGKNLLVHRRVLIEGLFNIETNGVLVAGRRYVGFSHKDDKTLLNIQGKLVVHSKFSIGRGCRLDIGENAVCHLGSGYINANTNLIIKHGLLIGDECAISWGCEFLDSDHHVLFYDGKIEKDPIIEIGDHVWIGSHVKILKGVKIASNNVIASNSVVTKSFFETNVLIAGNPAKIIRRNVFWGEQAKNLNANYALKAD
jgi:acetyltransferase-like isoleucine patch superfamily enzyme